MISQSVRWSFYFNSEDLAVFCFTSNRAHKIGLLLSITTLQKGRERAIRASVLLIGTGYDRSTAWADILHWNDYSIPMDYIDAPQVLHNLLAPGAYEA